MNTSKHIQGGGGLWKMLVVIVIGGYTLSSVLAFDGTTKQSTAHPITEQVPIPPLHTKIEDHVAYGVKNIRTNLVRFMQDGLEHTPSKNGLQYEKESPSLGNEPVVRVSFPESESVLLPAFSDIQTDPHKASIETLASIGIVQGNGKGEYNPYNHVRCGDFVRVLVDIYRYKQGYNLTTTEGLTDKQLLPLPEPQSLFAKKLNTAKYLGLLEGVALTRDQSITPLQVQKLLNNTFTLNPTLGLAEYTKMIDTQASALTKSEMARYLVTLFQLEAKSKGLVFRDIHNHRYQEAITQLAQLGVVAGRNGNFYPEQHVLRSDGVIMIANSLLAKTQKALVIKNFYHLKTIADVTYFATYAPHLEYLLNHEIGTSLLRHEQSGNLFVPDALLTQGEAYSLVAKAAGVKILNADVRITSQPITRGELANLLVEAFDFNIPTKTEIPSSPDTASPPVQEKKSLIISFLKDVVNEL